MVSTMVAAIALTTAFAPRPAALPGIEMGMSGGKGQTYFCDTVSKKAPWPGGA